MCIHGDPIKGGFSNLESEKIARINALARKKRTEGLTEAEAQEQHALRMEYLRAFRENTQALFENIRVEQIDGSYAPLEKKTSDPVQPAPRDGQ